LDTLSAGRELLDLGDLVLDVGAKAVGDGQLTAVDNNVHDVSLATRSSDSSDPMPLDGKHRYTVKGETNRVPPRPSPRTTPAAGLICTDANNRALSARVAPVVEKSSTTRS